MKNVQECDPPSLKLRMGRRNRSSIVVTAVTTKNIKSRKTDDENNGKKITFRQSTYRRHQAL